MESVFVTNYAGATDLLYNMAIKILSFGVQLEFKSCVFTLCVITLCPFDTM